VKLCKDCKHFNSVAGILQYFSDHDRATCLKTGGTVQSLVTGEIVKVYPKECVLVRIDATRCGLEGKWFEDISSKTQGDVYRNG